jgi:hypothetical protein
LLARHGFLRHGLAKQNSKELRCTAAWPVARDVKNNAAFQPEGGTVNRGLIPPCLYPQPARMAFQPDAPPWLIADNVLIFVLFP